MQEDIISITGNREGPTSIILAGVHGDEVCGVEALQELMPTLKIDCGTVYLGYGNPRAIERNKRFSEANLNRMFKDPSMLSEDEKSTYEYARAQFLKKYLAVSDALLDLHASQVKESKPFVICEANAANIVTYLPADLVVSGFDAVQPGGTDYYMNTIGKIGICLECGYLGDSASALVARKGIFAFLQARGHISKVVPITPQIYVRVYELYYTKSDDFKLAKPFKDFENIKKGQLIGVDGGSEVLADRDGVILFAQGQTRAREEAFLLGEKKSGLA